MRICTLSSGSSGNSIFVQSGTCSILIDAGITTKAIERGLSSADAALCNINGIFLTHEHSDHVKGIDVLRKRCAAPLYATRGTFGGMAYQYATGESDGNIIESGDVITVGALTVIPFSTPHDAGESVGYYIEDCEGKRVVIATDLGYVTESVANYISQADFLLLEANYDEKMLRNGPYPAFLKRRIFSENGHLSNTDCANAAVFAAQNGTKRIMLGHLSKENNRPEIAYELVCRALNSAQCCAAVAVAPRSEPSRVCEF